LKGTDFQFKEYEAISCKDQVQIPTSYSGKVRGKKIAGTVDDDKEVIDFSLELVDKNEKKKAKKEESDEETKSKSSKKTDKKADKSEDEIAKAIEKIKSGSEFKGTCYTPSPFVLQPKTYESDGSIKGKMVWTNSKTKTEIEGSLSKDGVFSFVEKEAKGEEAPPQGCVREYKASLSDGTDAKLLYGTFIAKSVNKKKDEEEFPASGSFHLILKKA